ncbi:MAG: radical SAM protein [Deltaproteobacteria bacterium]|nr:radical SAM protein [Deltaproteobacteria bacterium]
MAKILLITPDSKTFYGNPRYPAAGISMIGAVLLKSGHQVHGLDMRFSGVSDEILVKKIHDFQPEIIGFSVTNWDVLEAVRLARKIKSMLPDIYVIFGGPQVTLCPKETLRYSEIDFLVLGEGEITIIELIACLENKRPISEVKGIAFRDEDLNPVITDRRPLIKDLSRLPLPAYELFDPPAYRAADELRLGIMSSRGCPYQCIFCTGRKVMGRQMRRRSPIDVVSEMTHWHKKFGITHFCFIEDNWLAHRKHAMELLDGLEKAQLPITYSLEVGVRGDALSKDIGEKLKKTGCTIVAIGIESVDPEVLELSKKGETIEEITRGIRAAKAAGLFVKGYFIVALPGDTKSKVEKAVAYARKEKIDMPRFALAQAFPYTELAEWVKMNGKFYHEPYDYVLYHTDEGHGDVHYDFPGFPKEEIWETYNWAHEQAEAISFQRALNRRFGDRLGNLLNIFNNKLSRRLAIWGYQKKLISLPK